MLIAAQDRQKLVITDQSYRSKGYGIAVARVQKNAQLRMANSIEHLGKIQRRGLLSVRESAHNPARRAPYKARSPDAENTFESTFSIVPGADGVSIAHARPPLHLVAAPAAGCFGEMSDRT